MEWNVLLFVQPIVAHMNCDVGVEETGMVVRCQVVANQYSVVNGIIMETNVQKPVMSNVLMMKFDVLEENIQTGVVFLTFV